MWPAAISPLSKRRAAALAWRAETSERSPDVCAAVESVEGSTRAAAPPAAGAALRHARVACEVADRRRHPALRAARATSCVMELWELTARESIRDLVARYAHGADGGRFDDVAATFAPDGVLETPDRVEHRGAEAIRSFLGGTKTALANATAAPFIRHHVSNLRIELLDRGSATGAAYFFVITERGPDHWGRYRDRYVCLDGRWLFAHRRVRLDGYAPESWAAERRR
jgi:hypothetical protein